MNDLLEQYVKHNDVSTGFEQFDDALDGGLHSGLYVICAMPSIGKTTFMLQMADNIAQQEHDALIFSLEMPRTELIAKSISRNTALLSVSQNIGLNNAKTTHDITVGSRFGDYSQVEKQLIDDAVKKYEECARNLYIKECSDKYGVDEIREAVELHINFTGRRPAVFVDYLQVLAPQTDKAILELKRIARDYEIPVCVVSALSRSSYNKEITLASFYESDAIESSADVLIGMNYSNVISRQYNERKERDKLIKEIDVTVLKNRNGQTNQPIQFLFHSMFNFFEEAY